MEKTIVVNGNTYRGSEKYANNCLALAKAKLAGMNAIYALEKDGIIEMRRDLFNTRKQLYVKKVLYENKGFKVYYIEGGN